ncbi:MAG: flagellar basal body-associated FliL family protein, partial [Caulobacteraceae bacterium]|nr:flagellar basal body-associated FliL family protein [Caulobacteraceae bacterium]
MAKDVPEKDAENEEAAEGEAGEGAAKKKPPMMLIIIGAVVAVLLVGGGGTAAFLLMGHKAPASAQAAKAKPKKDAKKGDKKDDKDAPQVADGPDGVVFYTPPDIVVNMQTADGRPTFLKLKLTFELPDPSMADTLDENMPRLQDMFQTFLR